MDNMVSGIAHIAYYPVAALAALTAALVTLLVAVNAWRNSSERRVSLQSITDSSEESSESCASKVVEESDLFKSVDRQAKDEVVSDNTPDASALKNYEEKNLQSQELSSEEPVKMESNGVVNDFESRLSQMNSKSVNHVPLIGKETTEINVCDESECGTPRNRDLGEGRGAESSIKELDLTKLDLKLPSGRKSSKSKVFEALTANFEKGNRSSGKEHANESNFKQDPALEFHPNDFGDSTITKPHGVLLSSDYSLSAKSKSSKAVLLHIVEEGLIHIKRALGEEICFVENTTNQESNIVEITEDHNVKKDIKSIQNDVGLRVNNKKSENHLCAKEEMPDFLKNLSLINPCQIEKNTEARLLDSIKQHLEFQSFAENTETVKRIEFDISVNTATCEPAAKAEIEPKSASSQDSFNKCLSESERAPADDAGERGGGREEEDGEDLLFLWGERSQGVGGNILTEPENGVAQSVRSSCLLSPDVTSWSGKRAVQGSCREKQIEKACSESRVLFSSESPQSEAGVSPSPGSSMADSSSCTSHEAALKQPSDRFAPLDELVDHLRELAGGSPTVEASGVGLLSDYYADSGRKSADSWEYSASDASNYASDSSQSLQLSSYTGDNSSNFSSGPDSPHVYRRYDNFEKVKQEELFTELKNTLAASKTELKSHSLIKCCLGMSAGKSSPIYEEVNKKSGGRFTNRMEIPINLTKNESQRNLRLQKLLERDKERNERLNTLSGRCSSDANEVDPKTTLQAIESAVDHMKQLVQKECHEVHTTTRTMENFRNAEVRHFDLLMFDTTRDQGPDREPLCGRVEKSIDDLSSDNNHPNLGETKQEWDDLLSTVISVQSDYNAKSGEHVENEMVTVKSTNRWRSDVANCQKEFSLTEDFEVNVVKNEGKFDKAINLKKAEEDCAASSGFIDQNNPAKFDGVFGTTKWNERGRCLPVSPVRDVVRLADQSTPSRSGGRGAHRVDVAAANVSAAFSDEPRSQQLLIMDAEDREMENATVSPSSPPTTSPTANAATNTTPTPTKIKNLRFKLDPDIYDLPSENGYYDDDDQYNRRPGWRKQPKYQTFSSLEIGKNREPVKVVSVRTSVVPGGTKMVVKPVCVSEGQPSVRNHDSEDNRVMVKKLDIDLRIRLETQEREQEPQQSPDKKAKRSYLSSSSAQPKKRSPIPDSYWNQSLSPVSENCDFISAPVTEEGLLSTSSDPDQEYKMFADEEFVHSLSFSDFGVSAKTNGSPVNGHDSVASKSLSTNNSPLSPPMTSTPSRPSTLELNHFRKNLQLPRKKFVPDPDAVERITGFKAAESNTKPPLPPAIRSSPLTSHRLHAGAKNRIDQLRKRYLDSKHLIATQKIDSCTKFEEFLNKAQEDRAKIATSTPDLAAFEAAVRRQWYKSRNESNKEVNGKENSPPSDSSGISVRSSTPDDAWMGYVNMLRRQLNRRSQSMTYLETDVDSFFVEDKSRSTMTLERSPPNSTQSLAMPNNKPNRISMSLEDNGRTKSEHELRIERSLQNLTLPDWYKHSQRPKTGFILDKKNQELKGWAAVKSLTGSTTSLASSGGKPKKPAYSLRTSRENLIWSRGSASPSSTDNSYSNRYTKHSSTNTSNLSMALARAFREPYVGWRARTPSSCASPSPQVDCSPPSWVVMDNTDRSDTPLTSDLQAMDEEEDTGLSFDGEDVLEDAESSNHVVGPIKANNLDSPLPSVDDTCNDIINISMDTFGQDSKSCEIPGEDTCDDIKNISMDTCELLPPNTNEDLKASPIGDDTCDDVLNISSDTSCHVTPLLNGNQDPSSVIGVTENTGLDIDEISTDTSNLLSQPIINDNHPEKPSPRRSNLNDRSWGTDNCDKILQSRTLVNGNKEVSIPPLTNGDHHRVNGNAPSFHRFPLSEPMTIEEKDRQRKRYSYNKSIYQSEMNESMIRKNLNDRNNKMTIDGSCHSLPGDQDTQDKNKIIWIESSFVGSRATTSILVLPTQDMVKDSTCKGSNGSNTSVGRPASR